MLGVKSWAASLLDAETGEMLREMTVVASDEKHAHGKALYAWGVGHKVLIGTRIHLQPIKDDSRHVLR